MPLYYMRSLWRHQQKATCWEMLYRRFEHPWQFGLRAGTKNLPPPTRGFDSWIARANEVREMCSSFTSPPALTLQLMYLHEALSLSDPQENLSCTVQPQLFALFAFWVLPLYAVILTWPGCLELFAQSNPFALWLDIWSTGLLVVGYPASSWTDHANASFAAGESRSLEQTCQQY